MNPIKIRKRISWVGVIEPEQIIVDSLTPVPNGTSFNSFLIESTEKTALIDTVDIRKQEEFLLNINNVQNIDYIVVQHAELCHTGCIPTLLEKFPKITILCTDRAQKILAEHVGISEKRCQIVGDGEIISLGEISLQFLHTRFIHWPETMVTYIPEEKVLFTCDLFSAHYTFSEICAGNTPQVYKSAKRFFAEILLHYRDPMVKRVLEKIQHLDIELIAPGHGPIYEKPSWILEAYQNWVFSPPKNQVFLPYISMYNNTKKLVDFLEKKLGEYGVEVKKVNLEKNQDLGEIAVGLIDAGTIVIATPTIMGGPHPYHIPLLYLMSILKPKAEFLTIIGSYGWAKIINKTFKKLTAKLDIEILDPVLSKGPPNQVDFEALDRLALTIGENHRKLKL